MGKKYITFFFNYKPNVFPHHWIKFSYFSTGEMLKKFNLINFDIISVARNRSSTFPLSRNFVNDPHRFVSRVAFLPSSIHYIFPSTELTELSSINKKKLEHTKADIDKTTERLCSRKKSYFESFSLSNKKAVPYRRARKYI